MDPNLGRGHFHNIKLVHGILKGGVVLQAVQQLVAVAQASKVGEAPPVEVQVACKAKGMAKKTKVYPFSIYPLDILPGSKERSDENSLRRKQS